MGRFASVTVVLLAGLVTIGAAALLDGPNPLVVTAGAGVLGAGVVGASALGFDAAVRARTPRFGRRPTVSNVNRLAVAFGSGAVFVRVALVHVVADPLRIDGAALTAAAVATIGVVVGYRTAGSVLDGLRHGLLACGLGGVLCVVLAAYDAERSVEVETVEAFDVLVAGSGVVLPVVFGVFGGLAGAVGWMLADYLAGPDALA